MYGAQAHDVSGTITYRFDSSASAMQSTFNAAAGEWNQAFQSAGSNVQLVAHASGTIPISIDTSVCPDWGEGRNTASAQYLRLCPDTLTQGQAFVERIIRHEFGHVVGLGTGSCAKSESVMTDVQPSEMSGATTTVGCADKKTIEHYYEPPVCQLMPPCGQDEYLGSDGCCYQQNGSPILINLEDGSYEFSGAAQGVEFDIFGTGVRMLVAWPASDGHAFLTLDRDGDGRISSGKELFGNATRLLNGSAAAHGFVALAEYDLNHDGRIDAQDPVFTALRLWQDTARDGVSAPSELTPLSVHGIQSISLDYKTSQRRDRHGNVFRYRSKVDFSQPPTERYAYDVFLVVRPIQ